MAAPTFDGSGLSFTNMGWIYKTYQLTAQTTSSRLQFSSLTNAAQGPVLDAVSVTLSKDIVQDGSFDSPQAPADWFTTYTSGQTISPWSVASGSVKLGTAWTAAQGAQSLDLNGSEPGSVAQDLPTTPGQAYTLTFDVAADPFCGPAIKTVLVRWGGSPLATVSADGTGRTFNSMGWSARSYTVTATATTTQLRFDSLTNGACGPTLDAVSVVPATSNAAQ